MKTLLQNCRLIPELSGGWEQGLADVTLEGGKIAAIVPAGKGQGDEKLDCGGKTLMPGLFDLHMHINWAYHNGELRLNDFTIFIESCLSARLYLDNGITTVRDLGSAAAYRPPCAAPSKRASSPARASCARG